MKILSKNITSPLQISMTLGAIIVGAIIFSELIPYLGGLLSLFVFGWGIYYSMKHRSSANARDYSYWQNFGIGLLTICFTAFLYGFYQFVKFKFLVPELFEEAKNTMLEQLKTLPSRERKEMREVLLSVMQPGIIATFSAVIYAFLGVIIALISAGLVPKQFNNQYQQNLQNQAE